MPGLIGRFGDKALSRTKRPYIRYAGCDPLVRFELVLTRATASLPHNDHGFGPEVQAQYWRGNTSHR